ncbi:MAG: isoprenyl transferase [Planctomycetota bacterium]|nr:isoprenyl transferase [Planctomycetota bacterium]
MSSIGLTGASADPERSRAEQTAASMARLGLPVNVLPRHIAVIMDGNGRWAQQRGMPRMLGHQEGAKAVRAIVTECARLKIEVLTLYSFSIENWKRPADEVDFLMSLYVEYLVAEREEMMANNVRFMQVGRREGLPEPVLAELDRTREITASNTGLILALAINYGSRAEITDAVRALAREAKAGRLDPDAITEQMVGDHLYTAGLPDPDLLVRTAGEMRVSNYLLWQISYAEIHVADVCWPDFDVEQLHKALRDYAGRTRKFGAVVN